MGSIMTRDFFHGKLEDTYNDIRENVAQTVTENIPIMTSISAIDRLCFDLSLEKLEQRKLQEGTEPAIEDLLHTTGYWVIESAEWLQEDRATGNRPYRGVGVVPGQYQGYGTYQSINAVQEYNSMLSLCKELREKDIDSVLEIGSKRGGSFYLWTRALQPDLAISIDINFINRRAEFFERFSDVQTFCIENHSTSHTCINEVHELLHEFDHSGLDFVYIDGDHSYEQVKEDFETYESFIDGKGFIGLHDISHHGTGVPRLWSELQTKYKTTVFGEKPPKNGLVYIEE